jgi:hypothetical protein
MKVLLRHILEMPLLGRVGIDLHLGKKPKLGGRYADNSLIYTSYSVGDFVYPCFVFFLFLCCSCFIPAFQNTKRPKIFLLFLFVCFFSFLVLVCFTFYFCFDISKNPKRFCFVCYFLLVLKFENPKIFVFFSGFVKFAAEFISPVTPLELGYHFILFKPHK